MVMFKLDKPLQPELFNSFEIDRQFSVGKAMARGLATKFSPECHLEESRAFCFQMVHSYWHAKCESVGVDWEAGPGPAISEPVSCWASALFALLDKADWAFLRWRLRHQLANGIEHHLELFVVLFLHCGKLSCQILMSGNHLPQLDKGAHDGDVHLHSSLASQTLASMATPS